MELTRRRLLSATAGAASAGVLAGCTGNAVDDPGAESDGPTAQASFFVFGDVAERVAGDAATAELLVPVGQHGHGWEPGPSVREDIHGADLFVHGMDGFQPWVDSVRADLEADGADVATVDVSAGLDLLAAGGSDDHGKGDHDAERTDETDHDEGHDAERTDGAEADAGSTDSGHDHGDGRDPHFWMDPLRVREAVGTVRRGLADVDADRADAYASNAETFRSRLDDLHGAFESAVADASGDTLLVAGHDSFQYLRDRYGVDVEALTDVSPDDRPTPRDIERAQEVIEASGLRYVCADPLESQRAAEQLVAETDAEEVLPLTAMPGLTSEWESEDWGYVEVMENVNLPTLERALGVR